VTSLNFYQPMRDALHRNRHLEIMVAGGVFDLNTPYFGSFYGVSHVGLHPSLHKNIHLRRYPGGHQMYLDSKGLADLRRDASSFVSSVLGAGGGEASFGDRQESADNEPNP
jgi:carboxypeptidase C (cathepsin A)